MSIRQTGFPTSWPPLCKDTPCFKVLVFGLMIRGGFSVGSVAAIKKASPAAQKLVDGVGLGEQGSGVVFAVASFRFLLLLCVFVSMCVTPKMRPKEGSQKKHTHF